MYKAFLVFNKGARKVDKMLSSLLIDMLEIEIKVDERLLS